MKRYLIMLTIAAMAAFAGCGEKEAPEQEAAEQAAIADATEILTTVWADFDEENRFALAGGGYENMTMDTPGAIDPADVDSLTGLLAFPADQAGLIDDAASMMHMMNANTFTAGVYHLTDAEDQQALADALKESIMNTQWLCGFPDVMVIAGVNEDYVVTAIGKTALVGHFEEILAEKYDAAVIYEERLN